MKKISINKVRITPKNLSDEFKLCVFGNPSNEILEWVKENNLSLVNKEKFTDIVIPQNISLNELFIEPNTYEWMDGFSPNLNKKLHIGHFSNLVLAKAFKQLEVCKKTVSIYGDTLDGTKKQYFEDLKEYYKIFNFKPDKYFMASDVEYNGSLLSDGKGKYEGTKVFKIEDESVVGIKSTGKTSYFYQDVALAEILKASTLYLTGKEQLNHFNLLKKLYPNIEHIGLGLVTISGKKMGSRTGNVILIEELLKLLKPIFDDDLKLIYNVFAGIILKSNPTVNKNINLDIINNPKSSAGLYVSYTMARLNSAGCEFKKTSKFSSKYLEYAYLKAKQNFLPNILFSELIEHCKEINSLYLTNTIKGNSENKKMFENKLSDLIYACEKLGLFLIEKV